MNAAPRPALRPGRVAEIGLAVAVARSSPGSSRRRRLARRLARHRRGRGHRVRRARPRSCPPGCAAVASPGTRGHRAGRRLRRSDGLGRPLDRMVDRGRPVVGLAGARARVPLVPRARPPGRGDGGRDSARRGADGQRYRGRPRLGAPRRRDPVALPRRRPDLPAARAGRLLERARAPRGRGDRLRALGRPYPQGCCAHWRLPARVPRCRRAAPHAVAGGRGGRGRGARPLALSLRRAPQRRAARRPRATPGPGGRRLGVHAPPPSSRTAPCARTGSRTGVSSPCS